RRTTASPLPPRMGPRPLPLHLMSHASMLLASHAALPLWRNGSLAWKPSLAPEAEALRQSLDAAGPDAWRALEAAITAEAADRHQSMLAGIEAYRRHPYRRDLPPPPELWREGSTRLLDYRRPDTPGGLPVLVVPSLINRAYILDLTARRSLVRYLAARGLQPFLLDWDEPGPAEEAFTLTDYVAGRLGAALDRVVEATGRKAALVGYCMGGDLALAAALLHPAKVCALALLATPWDFHTGRESHGMMMRALAGPLGGVIEQAGGVPVDLLSAMFASLDPALAARKFAAFARLKAKSARARDFVALEDWANDGVRLAGPVARECLFGWYGGNDPGEGRWRVAGRPIIPEDVRVPTLAVVPARDRIVPPDSALPLARRIAGAKLMMVGGGHVGMLLSARAKTDVYGPLAKWLVRSALQ
ncbi:MAG TPA: alpha/beta fold hydrolase, partial [Candidatus Omnitrophota bacterium]|nr:alpha/beta fold hydrolase [Candidatus Omnitrophota bacterium]